MCLWCDLETDPSYKGLDFRHAGFRDAVWDLVGTVNAHPHSVLRCAGGRSTPVCLWNKPDPSCDPRPCLSAVRQDPERIHWEQGSGHRAQSSGHVSPSCWLLPQAAQAVLSQELLTWKVDSSESGEQVL